MTTIFVYAEYCTLSAQPVPVAEIEAKGQSDDWVAVEATEAEAAWWEARSRFGRRVAVTIRDHITATAAPIPS